MSQFWTEEENERFNMNLAFGEYADASEGELQRLRVLLHYLLTQLSPEEVCAILRRFRGIMKDAKAWAAWREEAREIVLISREACRSMKKNGSAGSPG
jgi:hypothetical protein